MALNLTAASSFSSSFSPPPPFLNPKHKPHLKLYPFRTYAAHSSDGTESWVKEEDPPASFSGSSSSARTQLDLLEQLTSSSSSVNASYVSDGNSRKLTIRQQLAQLVGDRDGDFVIPLGKNFKKVSAKALTVSQKRNIKRQAYLNEVSKRNDSVFFATIGAFVLVPPLVILGIAILTGYVQLFP
ncbi:hypothetical protein ACFX13_046823 [Malus domestica]|uniref:Uncharacterized protein n=1 Tax=Malus domestica TaxID=3750 RepID=A0A498JA93_MALDO|nr:hypothetical protein DVH24_032658 [Malus domestica]